LLTEEKVLKDYRKEYKEELTEQITETLTTKLTEEIKSKLQEEYDIKLLEWQQEFEATKKDSMAVTSGKTTSRKKSD